MNKTPDVHFKEYKQRVAHRTRRLLIAVFCVLAAPTLALMFNLGQDAWPMWLRESRSFLLGLLLFAELILMLLSPIIVEFNANPRRLSGPGKNPELPPDMQ
ncbi:MAG: hypothetical protein ACOY0R_03895 [Chloroflexota bacterium]